MGKIEVGTASSIHHQTAHPLILVVEDDPVIKDQLASSLPLYGFSVVAARNAEEARTKLESLTPSLILCDIRMPGMWGTDFKRSLDGDPHLSSIPFVFLSALSGMYHIREGLDTAADDYVTKPFRLKDLVSVIQMRLDKEANRRRVHDQEIDLLVESLQLIFPHEMVTPLSVIYGMADFLKSLDMDDEGDRASREEMLDAITAAASRLKKMSDRFSLAVRSNLLKTSQGYQDLEEAHAYDVGTFVADTVYRMNQGSWNGTRIRIGSIEEGLTRAPRECVHRMLEEVLTNALKFSPDDSVVEVVGTLEKGYCRIEINDSGPGMTQEEIDKVGIFRQFSRSKNEQQGLGLGLAVTKRLAELVKGSVEIDPRPGGGLSVQLLIPRAA